ncbi:hypothetical protein [Mycolicibacterium sp. 120270]|nr:hypothetical protein [Mycolicibacterium sp. 120270]MDX1883907.1 hypothetical protein [Mycolicibacterium sp. 120270]
MAAPDNLVWDIEAYDECMGKTVRDANQVVPPGAPRPLPPGIVAPEQR